MTLLAFAAAFNLIPLEDYIGFQISISLRSLLGIFIIALPMVLFASAVQMVIVSFTRSFKEAQTYTAFLPLIPAMPGILIGFMSIKPTIWHMLIPTFGQQMLISQYMRGETIDPWQMLVAALVSLLWTAAAAWLAIRLYQRERIIQGAR
jgi:sodium transport system permease protein